MQKLLLNMYRYLKRVYGIDLYTATSEQLLEAGKFVNGNDRYLPRTCRAKSSVRNRWRNSLWKKAEFLSNCKIEDIYTLLIELKTTKLYSEETAKLASEIANKLPGQWFYWVEEGKNSGVHMHVIVHSKVKPKSRVSHNGKYFQLKPLSLQHDKYEDPLEAIIRTIVYGAKIKQGGYRGDGLSWKDTWLNEIKEALDCERVLVRLSGSNMPTRGMKSRSLKIDALWDKVDQGRQRKHLKRSPTVSVYDLTA